MRTEQVILGQAVSFKDNGQEHTGVVVSLKPADTTVYGQVNIGQITPGIPGSPSVTRTFADLQGARLTFTEGGVPGRWDVKYSGVATSIDRLGQVTVGDLDPKMENRPTVTRPIIGAEVPFTDRGAEYVGCVESFTSSPDNAMVIGQIAPAIPGRSTVPVNPNALTASASPRDSALSPLVGGNWRHSRPE